MLREIPKINIKGKNLGHKAFVIWHGRGEDLLILIQMCKEDVTCLFSVMFNFSSPHIIFLSFLNIDIESLRFTHLPLISRYIWRLRVAV